MAATALEDGTVLMQAPDRRILIGQGLRGEQPFMAVRVQTQEQLEAFRRHVLTRGLKLLASPSAIFGPDALPVRDPDGRLAVFGLPGADLPRSLPAVVNLRA